MKNAFKSAALVLCLLLALALAACEYSTGHGVFEDDFDVSQDAIPTAPSSSSAPESSSVPEPVVTDIIYELPEGFEAKTPGKTLWYAPDYPYDPSSIALSASDKDYEFEARVQADYEAYLQEELDKAYPGKDIKLTITAFSHEEVDGWPAIRIEYRYTTDDYTVNTTMLMVNVDQRYTFIFTDTTDKATWQDAFEETIASIAFEIQ